MKLQQFNLISIIAASAVAGAFGAFPVTVHANKSPLIAMIAGGVGGTLPVSVEAKKSPLVAVAAGVGISTLPVPVHAGDNKCTKGDYGCGKGKDTADYWTESCGASQCCCRSEGFDGYRHSTCSGIERETKGCYSCLGLQACKGVASTVKIGDRSCVNDYSCLEVKGNSIIWDYSCRSEYGCTRANNVEIGPNSCGIGKSEEKACYQIQNSNVGSNSCQKYWSCAYSAYLSIGDNACNLDKYACEYMKHSTVGSNSCQKKDSCSYIENSNVGSNSCQKFNSCAFYDSSKGYGAYLSIGDNACNLDKSCNYCANYSIVPNGACSTSGADDVYEVYYDGTFSNWGCKYCLANNNMATVSASYTTSARRRLESADKDLEKDCGVLAGALLDYTDKSIEAYPAFRQLISSGDACNGKYKNVFQFTADTSTGTCNINLKQLWTSRPTIGDEPTGKEYIAQRIREFEVIPPILDGFTLTSLAATDDEFVCDATQSGKSGKSAPAQAQTIDDQGSKSGKSGSGKEEPKRKRQPSK